MNYGIMALVVLLSMPLVSAQEIISYNISVELGKDSAQENISVLIFNQLYYPLNTFSYTLRGDARNVEVYDREGRLNVNATKEGGTIIQSEFREPLQPNASTLIIIKFNMASAVSKVGEGYVFSPVFSLPEGTDEFRLKVRLPEGMGLPRPVTAGSSYTDVAPLPDGVYSDGRAIILAWRRYDVSGDFAVYIRYAEPGSKSKNYYLLGFFLILALAIFYLSRSKRRTKERGLDRDEMTVLELIKANNGVAQRDVVNITGFSKAKVSAVVSSLEKKGLIRKEKAGLINRLYLMHKYKKF
jgi:uncharacterized membrane protein